MFAPLLFGILMPALAAGACWGLGWRVWKRRGSVPSGAHFAGAPALALAFVAGCLLTWGWPGFPPRLAEDWLPFLALLGWVAGLRAAAKAPGLAVVLVLCLGLAAASLGLTLGPKRAVWSTGEAVAWHAGIGLASALVLAALELLAEARPGASLPLALWLWCAGIAGSLALTGSIKYGQIAGLLAAALGAGVVAAWLAPRFTFWRGPLYVLVPVAVALLACGHFYSDLPLSAAIVLALAPLALWLGELSFVDKRPAWLAVPMRMALVGLPVAAALLISAWPMLYPPPKPAQPASEWDNRY
ncbi:MAG: hypothetical protein KIS92_00525 [Planctomycetota bacterium]|nr:hypothetical protein [Planctomycetota bacterium]